MLRSAALGDVPHGFSTRTSEEVPAELPGIAWFRVRQVHGAKVRTLTCPRRAGNTDPVEADAMVTSDAGIGLSIVTADCAPVLFADVEAGVVGAAHAGWRGVLAGVCENTVAAMADLGARPSRMIAVIGPTIAQASYEVDAAFRERFDADAGGFFGDGREGRYRFDLPAYVASRLRRAGVGEIDDIGYDTYADPSLFHSYRRATHDGTTATGRQVSVIARRPSKD